MNNRWRQIEKLRKRHLAREGRRKRRMEKMIKLLMESPKSQAILSAKHLYCQPDIRASYALRSELIKEKMRLMYGGDENE